MQYASYALTDALALNVRGEVRRDDNNFFIAAFPGNSSYVQVRQRFPALIHAAPGTNTTYGALTIGADAVLTF